MRRSFNVIVLTLLSSGLSASPPLSKLKPLVGAWQLLSVETVRPNGESLTRWMGKAPTGMILYDPSGMMSVQWMRDPRPLLKGDDFELATESEKALAASGYYAYFGHYEVDKKAQKVTHHVQASMRPEEVGVEYSRTFIVIGDRLTLTTPMYEENGEKLFNRVTCKRVK